LYSIDAYTVALQTDGKILAGGRLLVDQSRWTDIVRLLPDGTLDPDFKMGEGFGGSESRIWKITLREDGKIYVAGEFTNYDGSPNFRLVRLNGDGTKDTNFVGELPNEGYNYVDAPKEVLCLPDGSVLVPWWVSWMGSTILRFNEDGTSWETFSANSTFGTIHKMIRQDDGRILVSVSGILLRLNADGSRDSSFAYPIFGVTGYSLALQGVNRVLVTAIAKKSGSANEVNDVGRIFLQPFQSSLFAPASLTVNEDGRAQCIVDRNNAHTLVLQATTNFVDWQNCATNQGTNEVVVFTDIEAPTHSRRFYRIWVVD